MDQLLRIEQYESGTLSAAERSAFEAELASNTDLYQAHQAFLQANAVMEQGIENSLRSQLNGWAGEVGQTPLDAAKPTGSKVVFMQSTWIRMAVAASVTLLLGWFGFQWAGSQYSDQALYAGHYEKPADSVFRSSGAGENPLQEGYDAMKANNLESAVAFFSAIPADNDRYAEAEYYLGHANLQLKRCDAAIAAFQQVAARTDSKFREKAEWNLVLTYVAAGRTEEASFRALLAEMAGNSSHSFYKQAKELQEKTGAFWRKFGR